MISIEKAEAILKKETENEVKFCEEEGLRKNGHGVFQYKSIDVNNSINMPLLLRSYKEWLLDEGILKEKF